MLDKLTVRHHYRFNADRTTWTPSDLSRGRSRPQGDNAFSSVMQLSVIVRRFELGSGLGELVSLSAYHYTLIIFNRSTRPCCCVWTQHSR